MVTVDDVISHPWEVGDEYVMSACLGAFEVVPEGRREVKGEEEGQGKGEGERERERGINTVVYGGST